MWPGFKISKHLPRVIVLLFVALLSACGSSSTSTPGVTEVKPSGALNHGVAETGVFQGHPAEVSSPRIQYMSTSIGDGLVTIGEDLLPNSMIAQSWDVSADFLSWT